MAYSNDFLVRLPGRFWPPGSLRLGSRSEPRPVDAFQHVAELRLGDWDNAVRGVCELCESITVGGVKLLGRR